MNMIIDTSRQPALPSAASPTMTSKSISVATSRHHHLDSDHLVRQSQVFPTIGNSSPPHPKRSGGFRRTGLSFSTSSVSSTASRLKPFLKYRPRRSSDDSLTDLSPPNHTDLDQPYPPLSASSTRTDSAEPSPSLTPSHRTSAIFLGNLFQLNRPSSSASRKHPGDTTSLSRSLSQRSSADNQPSNHMPLFKSEGNNSSFSLRLRLLSSKQAPEKQLVDKIKSVPSKAQAESLSSATAKSTALKSFQGRLDKTHECHQSDDSDELEAIKSPSSPDLRIVAHPDYCHGSLSSIKQFQPAPTPSPRVVSRTSSSPNLSFPSPSFSSRLSGESTRSKTSANSTGSPKKGRLPPPIIVPKLRTTSIAIAIGSDQSPTVMSSGYPPRLVNSSSESGHPLVRRFAGIDWSASPRKMSAPDVSPQPGVEHTNPYGSSSNFYSDLAAGPNPRSGQIPISNACKFNKEKAPAVMSLQPAPRRLSGQASHSTTDSRNRTAPLLISKHSRSICNAARAPPSEHSGPLNSTISKRDSWCSVTSRVGSPKDSKTNSATTRFDYPQTPNRLPTSPQDTLHSPGCSPKSYHKPSDACGTQCKTSIPFPTSDEPAGSLGSDPTVSFSKDACNIGIHLASDCRSDLGCGKAPHARNHIKFPPASNDERITSFDIRSLPLRLETTISEDSETLSPIAIPQPITIPQFLSDHPPVLSELDHIPSAPEIITKPNLALSVATLRPHVSSEFSSMRSGLSVQSFVEANRASNRTSTPTSTTTSNCSSSSLYRKISYKSGTPTFLSTVGSRVRSLSVDTPHFKTSGVILDLTRREGRKCPRPRSMSDCGPDRDQVLFELLGDHKDSLGSLSTSPSSPEYLRSASSHVHRIHSPNCKTLVTTSIERQIRDCTPSQLMTLVERSLKAYHPDSHRFFVGDVKQLIQGGRHLEQKAHELHVRFIADLHRREKLLQRHVMTLCALNGNQGARFGDSLMKLINQTDELVCELFGIMEHSSKIERICQAHWRAAATVQMKTNSLKAAQLESSQARVKHLESERRHHLNMISELQAQVDSLQNPARPSSTATDTDSISSGSIASVNVPRKKSQDTGRGGFLRCNSPSSTPRISHFPFHFPQPIPHASLVQSRMRFNSTQSYSSAPNLAHYYDNGVGESGPFAPLGEPVSPRTAFLSSYGLTHTQASTAERSESLSSSTNKPEPGSSSPRRTHKPSYSSASPACIPQVGNLQRSDSLCSKKNLRPTGLVSRGVFLNNNPASRKVSMSPLAFRNNRCSSFTSSDVKSAADLTSGFGPTPSELKSGSSNLVLPPPPGSHSTSWSLKNGANPSAMDPMPSEGAADFQPSLAIPRGGASLTLSRFPPQVPPAPSLPLPSEPSLRCRGKWSPSTSNSGNLSSITLSQLGSIDIANLLSNIESFNEST